MSDGWCCLGSKGGPAIRPGGPWPSSSLLELGGRTIVVDCGLGVTRGLVDAGVSLKALDLIFITHLHSDHVLELGPLLHTAWTAGLASAGDACSDRPAPATTGGTSARRWSSTSRSASSTKAGRISATWSRSSSSAKARFLTKRGLKVSALRVDHPPVTDCFALRFEHGGKSIVFSADTAFFPPLAGFASDADILVHEAMLEEGIERLVARTGNGARLKEHLLASHTFAAEAGRIASRCRGEAGWCSTTSFRPTIPRSARPIGSPPSGNLGR